MGTLTEIALRRTGLAKMLNLLGYFAVNLPKTTTAAGVVLMLGTAAIRLDLMVDFSSPTYLQAYFGLLVAVSLLSAALLVLPRRGLTRLGWWLGSVLSLASIAMYLTSHTAGLPELPNLIGHWDYPLGTFAMILLGGFLAVHFLVLTKVSIAYPDTRDWRDEVPDRSVRNASLGTRKSEMA